MRQFRLQARFHITEIFARQRVGIVFRMAGNKRNALIFAGEEVGIAICRFRQDIEIGVITDQRSGEISIARVRREEIVIKAARQQGMRLQEVMLINAGKFIAAGLLRNAVEDIECCLHGPTDEKRGGDVIFCPCQHLLDLRPVGNIVELDQA